MKNTPAMENRETANRRNFLRTLGLSLGAVVANSQAFYPENAMPEKFELTPEQADFMNRYRQWTDEYITAIQGNENAPGKFGKDGELERLNRIALEWQPQLSKYLEDKDFETYFFNVFDQKMNMLSGEVSL